MSNQQYACHFEKAFREAICKVPKDYFSDYERIYSYELYHQIRILIHKHKKKYPPSACLHSEAVKLHKVGTRLELTNLTDGQSVVPDMIFHSVMSVHNLDHQIAAVEIKAQGLCERNLYSDLKKLTDYKYNYGFSKTIFHCINYSRFDLEKILSQCDSSTKTNLASDIVIMAVKDHGQPIEKFNLEEIL